MLVLILSYVKQNRHKDVNQKACPEMEIFGDTWTPALF